MSLRNQPCYTRIRECPPSSMLKMPYKRKYHTDDSVEIFGTISFNEIGSGIVCDKKVQWTFGPIDRIRELQQSKFMPV